MADYVGFTAADAGIIRRTRPIIAKYLPEIVSEFYTHLLRYPLTRKLFLRPDGTIDEPYLNLRIATCLISGCGRRKACMTAKPYAYVVRRPPPRGADPASAPEHVIGQVGMMQRHQPGSQQGTAGRGRRDGVRAVSVGQTDDGAAGDAGPRLWA